MQSLKTLLFVLILTLPMAQCISNSPLTSECADGVDCNTELGGGDGSGTDDGTSTDLGIAVGGELSTNDVDCDGIDDDSDDSVGDDIREVVYADSDSDGYGDASSSAYACADSSGSLPSGYVSDATDCNDEDSSINPDASEIVADGIDQNCDDADKVLASQTRTNYNYTTSSTRTESGEYTETVGSVTYTYDAAGKLEIEYHDPIAPSGGYFDYYYYTYSYNEDGTTAGYVRTNYHRYEVSTQSCTPECQTTVVYTYDSYGNMETESWYEEQEWGSTETVLTKHITYQNTVDETTGKIQSYESRDTSPNIDGGAAKDFDDGDPWKDFTYNYDDDGNLSSIDYTTYYGSTTAKGTGTYTYNSDGNKTKAVYNAAGHSSASTWYYEYDEFGTIVKEYYIYGDSTEESGASTYYIYVNVYTDGDTTTHIDD